jgi:hypothetical protein
MRRLSIALLLCLPFVAARSGQPSPPFQGLLGMPLAEAPNTDFFTFFHLEETGRQPAGTGTIITFKPGGAQFRELVTLRATVTDQRRIIALRLDLAHRFIAGSQGVFANDIAKSFLADGPPGADRGALHTMVDEIQSNRNSETAVLSGQPMPQPPARASDGYLTYLGKRQAYSQTLTVCSLHMENTKESGEDWLQIQLTATH